MQIKQLIFRLKFALTSTDRSRMVPTLLQAPVALPAAVSALCVIKCVSTGSSISICMLRQNFILESSLDKQQQVIDTCGQNAHQSKILEYDLNFN